jgi:hypothetical protein
VRKYQDEFQMMLLEQSTKPMEQRCPIARASLAITSVMYDHFEVDKTEIDDTKSYLILESRSNLDKLFKPLLLHWSRLHVAGLHAFFRIWKATGAELEDFGKIVELIRILTESVVGGAARTKDIQDVEEEMADFEYQRLRELQMELLELTYEDAWGAHLLHVRDELQNEALQFVKEQRIRCLLQGAWFPTEAVSKGEDGKKLSPSRYRYVQLSHNRRFLHYAEFDSMDQEPPELEGLPYKRTHAQFCPLCQWPLTYPPIVDLNIVSSVVSNVTASSDSSSASTIKTLQHPSSASTKITIHGYTGPHTTAARPQTASSKISTTTNARNRSNSKATTTAGGGGGGGTSNGINGTVHAPNSDASESVLLVLHPQTHSVASEWLDGLLMLLNQQPITAETNKLINLVSNYGLKIRLLNVRFDDATFVGECPDVPSREGLDENYYYDIYGGA